MTGIETITDIGSLRARLDAGRASGRRVGFVPTMGYLHAGHGSLIESSAAADDLTVVSIFVNPLQFAAGEDLDSYPSDLPSDLALAEAAGADVVFHPSVDEMYPRAVVTSVSVAGLSERLEGASRPTHFAGVATVVAKLFAIVGPCRAYFGEKDFQQLAVIRRMTDDLSIPVEVVGCPIVREADGLARSSRNVYLSAVERAAAPVFHRALVAGRDAIRAGERSPEAVEAVMAGVLATEPLVQPDYTVVVDAENLQRPDTVTGDLRLLVAGRLGRPRLLDNLGVTV